MHQQLPVTRANALVAMAASIFLIYVGCIAYKLMAYPQHSGFGGSDVGGILGTWALLILLGTGFIGFGISFATATLMTIANLIGPAILGDIALSVAPDDPHNAITTTLMALSTNLLIVPMTAWLMYREGSTSFTDMLWLNCMIVAAFCAGVMWHDKIFIYIGLAAALCAMLGPLLAEDLHERRQRLHTPVAG